MKKFEEVQSKQHKPIWELNIEFAKKLKSTDSRLECFLQFVPPPIYLREGGYFRTRRKTKAIVGGNKCVSGSTMIYDPVLGKERRIDEIKEPFHVLSWNGSELVVAKASTPFIKAYDQMFDVSFSNGQSLRCTADHLFLTPSDGYVALRHMRSSSRVFLPMSSLEPSPSVRKQGVHHWTKKAPSSQSDYPAYYHSGDEQLHQLSGNGQYDVPSPVDVPQCNFSNISFCNTDGQDKRFSHNPVGSRFCHRSTLDEDARVWVRFWKTTQPQVFEEPSVLLDTRTRTFSQSQKADILAQPCPVCPSHVSSTRNLACDHPYVAISGCVGFITTIEQVGQENVWDISVDKHHNYLAAGVINHNSYKTTVAVWEDVMIYTGMIPAALKGVYAFEKDLEDMVSGPNRRPRHVRIIIQDYSKALPETIMPMLLGDPKEGGRGFLPEMWSNWNPDTHMFEGPDGSFLSIMSVDPTQKLDPRRLRGPLVDHTHICENTIQLAYSESLTRSVGLTNGPKDVTFEYCPQDGFEDWTYSDIYCQSYDPKTDEPLPEEKQNDAIFVQRVTMRDNPDMDEKEIQAIEKSIPPHQVAFRIHGKYSSVAANPYFNITMLQDWYKGGQTSDGEPYLFDEDEVNLESGIFKATMNNVDIHYHDEGTEPVWRVWEKARQGSIYVLSGDTAMGNPESDYQVADILKLYDFKKFIGFLQVAQLRMKLIKPGDFAVQCALAASAYGLCMIVPEVMGESGGIFIDRIRRYPELYTRLGQPTKENNDKPVAKFGWHTDRHNKPLMLETLYKTLQKCYALGYCPINSIFSLNELMSFEERVIKDKMNDVMKTEWGNRPGAHDDTVISLAIGNRILVAEKDRLSACNISGNGVKHAYESELEREAANVNGGGRAFSDLKAQPSLEQLRTRLHGRQAQ